MSTLRLILSCLLFAATAAAAVAQCQLAASAGDPVSMPRGRLRCSTLWDPDGAGPAPLALVVGGRFAVAAAECDVAMFDGTTWTPLDTPSSSFATALVVHNGDLVAAVGGQVYRRTGGAWVPLGIGGSGAQIEAMAVFNGEIVIGGSFSSMGGAVVHSIARWNGTAWSGLGSGMATAGVRALAVYTYQNQSALYVGGSFATAGGVATNNLAIWTGTTWAATAGCNAPVNALAVRLTAAVTTSYLIVGGEFSVAGGVPADKVARFSVSTNAWTNLGAMPSALPCTSLLVRSSISSYEVVAAQGNRTSLWSGSGWNYLGPAPGSAEFAPVQPALTIETVSWFGGRYVVGCDDVLSSFGGVWSFDGVAWQTMDGAGIPRPVLAVVPMDGDVVIGGAFDAISGVTVHGIARGSANAWQPLGGGVTGGTGAVEAIVRMPNGDLVAGGTFTVAGGGVANNIARWNGANWQPLGAGIGGAVHALAVMPNGDLIAGGWFSTAGGVVVRNVARWNGAAWSDVGGGCDAAVRALTVLTTGELVAGGEFVMAGAGQAAAHVARFNGVWLPMGNGVNGTVFALAATPNGGLIVGGAFSNSGGPEVDYIARWNGFAFLEVTSTGDPLPDVVRAIAVLPDGTLVVGGGSFAISLPIGTSFSNVVRLEDPYAAEPWESLPAGWGSGGLVFCLAVTPSGEVIAGGHLHRAASSVSANVIRLATTCPASAIAYGSGCVGSGGTNTLAAVTLPWDRTTLRTRATGMPPQGVVLTLFGFTQVAVPIAALLAEGGAGCDLLTTPDVLGVALPVAGVVDTAVYMAPSPSLIGVTFYQQLLPFQDFGSGPLVITATNGLALTGGSY